MNIIIIGKNPSCLCIQGSLYRPYFACRHIEKIVWLTEIIVAKGFA